MSTRQYRMFVWSLLILISILVLGCTSPKERAREKIEQMGIEYSEDSFVWKVEEGDLEVVKLFLKAGIRPNAKRDGGTVLHCAAYYGHIEVVKVLIEAGAEVNAKREGTGETPLMEAVQKGHTQVVKLLIKAGADVNIPTEFGRVTPLMDAARLNYTEIAQALIEAGADVNVKDKWGRTALQAATLMHHDDIVQILREAGAKE